jgi:hypothetical protein
LNWIILISTLGGGSLREFFPVLLSRGIIDVGTEEESDQEESAHEKGRRHEKEQEGFHEKGIAG